MLDGIMPVSSGLDETALHPDGDDEVGKTREQFEEEHDGVELPCSISLKYKKRGSLKRPDGTTNYPMCKRFIHSEKKVSQNTADASDSKIDCDNSRRISN
jgi:hypothetical protein